MSLQSQIPVKMDAPAALGLWSDWFPRQNIYIKHPPTAGEGFSNAQAERIASDLHEILMFLKYQQSNPIYPPQRVNYPPAPYAPPNPVEPPPPPPPPYGPPPWRPPPYAPGQGPPQSGSSMVPEAPGPDNSVPFRIPPEFGRN
jgi:hypothetical protein